MRRFELADAQWEQPAPLLTPQWPRTGRPAEDHRHMQNGMRWILLAGACWPLLDRQFFSDLALSRPEIEQAIGR